MISENRNEFSDFHLRLELEVPLRFGQLEGLETFHIREGGIVFEKGAFVGGVCVFVFLQNLIFPGSWLWSVVGLPVSSLSPNQLTHAFSVHNST
jgi:hypothetical protein